MNSLTIPLSSINRTMTAIVGGKAANLGDMIQASETKIPVPPGFVVTSQSYRQFITAATTQDHNLEQLFQKIDDMAIQHEKKDNSVDLNIIRSIGQDIRTLLRKIPIPDELSTAISQSWMELETDHEQFFASTSASNPALSVAVRSSATAEDLPSASFAGQQDTYLNIVGKESVLQHVKSCWISLFTDRAITYRIQNSFYPTSKVYLCVMVQKQVHPTCSGIMFTADAMTGNRNMTVIEAGYGLGEALVSGLINADQYKYNHKSHSLIETTIGDKSIEIVPTFDHEGGNKDGIDNGTKTIPVEKKRQESQVLSEKQIGSLVQMGQDIQQHYQGIPQDIEWCIEDTTNKLYIVQSRPITTLFPLPKEKSNDTSLRVYLSFGHQQVMLDPMKPCSHSAIQYLMFVGRDKKTRRCQFLKSAGSYVFADLTAMLQVTLTRKIVYIAMGRFSPEIQPSLKHVVGKKEFLEQKKLHNPIKIILNFLSIAGPVYAKMLWTVLFEPHPEKVTEKINKLMDDTMRRIKSNIWSCEDITEQVITAKNELIDVSKVVRQIFPYFGSGMLSYALIGKLTKGHYENDTAHENDMNAFTRGLSGNVTTEMDLELGDLADIARKSPTVSLWLSKGDDLSLHGLSLLDRNDSHHFRDAFQAFLDKYGMRGNSEIDISRPRWLDDPSPLLQVLRGNLLRNEPGHHRAHHLKLQTDREAAARRLLAAAPWYKKPLLRRLLRVARGCGALREHHKFLWIRVYGELRQVILNMGDVLVKRGCLNTADDIWMLDLDEIIDALSTDKQALQSLIRRRKDEFAVHSKLKPPIVLTSDGECVNVKSHNHDVPPGALGGLGTSSGVVEGIAKVIMNPTNAVLHSGEILVTRATDPGWTPLFINAAGLVMEVGGYLTHGSVVSREYGIPAVSCISNATTVLKTGMRVRVDGTRGFVEILSKEEN